MHQIPLLSESSTGVINCDVQNGSFRNFFSSCIYSATDAIAIVLAMLKYRYNSDSFVRCALSISLSLYLTHLYALIGQYVNFTFSYQIVGMKTYKNGVRIHIQLPREYLECKPISNRSYLVTAVGSEIPATVASRRKEQDNDQLYSLSLNPHHVVGIYNSA